jgi:hypothetical protein
MAKIKRSQPAAAPTEVPQVYATGVGAGEACDLLLFSGFEHAKIKRSQPAAASTGGRKFWGCSGSGVVLIRIFLRYLHL